MFFEQIAEIDALWMSLQPKQFFVRKLNSQVIKDLNLDYLIGRTGLHRASIKKLIIPITYKPYLIIEENFVECMRVGFPEIEFAYYTQDDYYKYDMIVVPQ